MSTDGVGSPARKRSADGGASAALAGGHQTARHRRFLYRYEGKSRYKLKRPYWQAYCEQCAEPFLRRASQWEASLDARAHRNGWGNQTSEALPR